MSSSFFNDNFSSSLEPTRLIIFLFHMWVYSRYTDQTWWLSFFYLSFFRAHRNVICFLNSTTFLFLTHLVWKFLNCLFPLNIFHLFLSISKAFYPLFANTWASWSRVPKSVSKFLKLSFYHTLRVKVGVNSSFFLCLSLVFNHQGFPFENPETSLLSVSAFHSHWLLLQDLVCT